MAFNKKNMTPRDLVSQSDQYERLLEWFPWPEDVLPFLGDADEVWAIVLLPIWVIPAFSIWVFSKIRWRIQNFAICGVPTKYKDSITEQLENAGATFGWKTEISKYIKTVPAKKKEVTERDIRKEAKTNLIVATLIATVTFTAGFTMPGGYVNEGSDKGMATLAGQAAFQIFVISNTLAMILSTCAVFSHFLASGLLDKNKALKHYGTATFLIVVAMIAMVVSFTAGTCGALAHSLGLVIPIAFIGGLCSLIYCRILWKTCREL